ncbi:Protein ACP-5 [Aphelenchoides avenae]|nr:Protein ACP-5 [Aphelenchus avenae]
MERRPAVATHRGAYGAYNRSRNGKLNQTEAYFRLFRLFSPAIKELEVLTGMKIPSLYIFQKVLDAIKTRAGLGDILPLPKWANNTKFLDKIENLQNSVHGKFIDLFNEDVGGWHFDQLVSRMDEAINNRTKHKAILYSGHDTNILTIGRLLNLSVINETMQDFSTYLAIELLEEDDGRHIVKVFLHKKLNGTRIPLDVAECGKPCTFERFVALRRRVTTQEWLARCTGMTLVNVGEECAFYGTLAGSLLLLVVILIGSLLSVLWTCRSYKRRYLQLSDPERMPLLSADYMGAEPVTAGPRRPDGYRQLPLLKERSAGLET